MKKIKVSEKTMEKIQTFLSASGGVGICWAVGYATFDAIDTTGKSVLGLFNANDTVPGRLLSKWVSLVGGLVAGSAVFKHCAEDVVWTSELISNEFFEVKPEETETE